LYTPMYIYALSGFLLTGFMKDNNTFKVCRLSLQ
jgi:hypothetical protein